MAKKNKWLQRTLLASALLMAGPLSSASAAVVTSIRPLGFIASAIADGVTPTEVLLPDGASPHDFALRPSDIQRLRSADLVLWVGPDMEAFLNKALVPISATRKLAVSELPAVKPLLMKGEEDDDHDHAGEAHNHADDDHGHHHGEYNMHVWLSPEIAKVTAIAIHDRLLELMPQNKDKLDANLRQFENLLTQTDKNVGNMLTPVQGKGYFVFHDAYGYFEKHYGLSPLGHFTVNPEIQPGAQRLHQIRTQLVEQKAVCVFAEPQFRPAVINAVAKGTKVRSGTLDPLGTGIALGKDSYGKFLAQLSNQYVSCLK
ncbi:MULTISPECIES: zinc ABC transporter substrate-binding protein ZnuA [Serratia]|uniref:High-affinity zinc uptake system protein ZnuA n=1 Tax=Serratia marcescens TaxID=615 RepID=A0A5C7CGA9_SERMA|nr:MULTISPECIES: zinc ABC transporter substrate-binding protein ZnuA [Serratia]ASM19817.1 zinc ABC transporter substrate-binding protein [Serratia marcescens]AWO81655.1 zinc ABC transporter substrate-binding protein [Serratia marcescens]EGT0450938.1 zinc ABC transporter substrate-binding protein ZnuA [Serratia marcescens]EKX2166515.1 zinc ABC transporter substrate-binding protein ZnuA [Serratia marcescens]ELA7780665.1 zinc ABC transporter substrate-binding protein ZnuA [Serratia marcescens]